MLKRLLLAGLGALALTACDGGGKEDYSSAPAPMAEMMEMRAPVSTQAMDMDFAADEAQAGRKMMPPNAPFPNDDSATAPSGPMLAYVHNRSIESPSQQLGGLVETHQQRCTQAGPQVCMVVNASQSGIGEDWGNANLHIKATPQWTQTFLGGLEGELEGSRAKITSSSTYAEDLSTQIIDTDARLKAKITLRDRLQGLLTDRPSELGDLIALERELARVQADIDSAASVLEALKQRVAMSNIHMSYSALREPTAHSVWRPLGDALNSFFGNFAGALGAIITTIAVVLPWIPVIIGLIWVARVIWRRVFRRKQSQVKQTAGKAASS